MSVRRFSWRPASLVFGATGFVEPLPIVWNGNAAVPGFVSTPSGLTKYAVVRSTSKPSARIRSCAAPARVGVIAIESSASRQLEAAILDNAIMAATADG